jgi:hypothetical protein
MVGHNFKMRIGEMPLARGRFPSVLYHDRSVVAAVLSGNCRVYRIVLSVPSTDGCSARYGYRDVLGVFQGKFSQFDCDLLDAESFQQMRRQSVGKCLDQICRLIAHKILRLLSNNRIIDRVVDLVGDIPLVVIRPERNANSQPLVSSALFFWNSDTSRNLKLLDVNFIRERM